MGNFLHNVSSYGVDFLIGHVHPVLLTLGAMVGWIVIYRRDKKVSMVLAGWLSLDDMAVACFPEEFTSVGPSFKATDIEWFLQEPLWRQEAFKRARKVYLIDDIFSQRRCQGAVFLIKEQGKAVLVKQWTQGSARFAVHSLSRF